MAFSSKKRASAEERELGFPAVKRKRDVTRAAELVLVLAAMGEMRGGVDPTPKEREVMAEAREKLVRACEGFVPKDVFPREAFGSVMEDVGFTRLEDKKLEFRPSKMSIGEKFLISKHKRFQTNSGTALPISDMPSLVDFPSVRVQSASPLDHGSTVNSTSQPYQLPASEVRTPSQVSGRESSTQAVPRVDRSHFRPETRLNGLSYALPTKVKPCRDQAPQKSPAFVQQVQSSLSGKSRSENKVITNPSYKVEGASVGTTSRVAPQSSRSLPTQAPAGQFATIPQLRGMNKTQASSLSNPHIEIGNIVQKFLQLQMPRFPIWTPPSRDYMNKSMHCQVCKVTINEVINALVCDACEKGYHIKCVESHSQKGVPKGEWHCFKCLSLSNGKPLAPKYGRVTKNMSAPKVHSNTATIQSSPEMKVEKLGEKENQANVIANGSADLRSPAGNHTNSETEINQKIGRESLGDDVLSRRGDTNGKNPLENFPGDIIKCSGSGCASDSAGLSVERAHEEKPVFELKGLLPLSKTSETGSEILDHLEAPSILLDKGQEVLPDKPEVPLLQCHSNNLTVEDSDASYSRKALDGNVNGVIRKQNQGVLRQETTDLSADGTIVGEGLSLPSDVSDNVDWIGHVLQVVDEKIYYQSCCVDGVVYKVQDHALLYTSHSNDQFTPSKLQAMWEDRKNRSKWVIANRCYFHDDLPKEDGRPSPLESNEVCESNHGITILAGLLRGPCEVLPPGKHIEESQRRLRMSSRENDGLRPIFLCKWFFDETKGSFRDVSS